MNIRETAAFLEISESQVRNLIRDRQISHYRFAPRLYRIDLADADEYRQRTRGPDLHPLVLPLGRAILKNAEPRGIEVSLSAQELDALCRRANGRCELTGISFSSQKPAGARMRPWMPSVDRIDTTSGYSAANCRIICAYLNLAINDFGEELFATLAAAFIARRGAG